MSYKQRAIQMLADLGASDAGSEFDDMFRHWTVDYRTPKGKRWAATGDHMSWTREDTMSACWKSLIETARMGLEDCPSSCDCFLEADPEPVAVEPRVIVCRTHKPISWDADEVTWGSDGVGKVLAPCSKCGMKFMWNVWDR